MKPRLSAGLCAAALLVPLLLAAPGAGTRVALVVGIKDYDSAQFPDLSYTENDAEAFASLLKGGGFDVAVLTTSRGKRDAADAPTAANLRARLKGLLAKAGREDTVLIAVSGHGLQSRVVEGGRARTEGFFCPADARTSASEDLKELSKTLLGMTELADALDGSRAGLKLVLVDACRDEPALPRGVDSTAVRLPRNTAGLFSCSAGERSFETPKLRHGVFFYHVIEGLKGGARNADGAVTWGGLSEYVIPRVQKYVAEEVRAGARQTPEDVRRLSGVSPVLLPADIPAEKAVPPKEHGKYVTNSVGMKLALIPAGPFLMGSPAGEKGRFRGETQHKVRITRSFHLGMCEVTQKQFRDVMGYNPSYFSRDGKRRGGKGEKYSAEPTGGQGDLDGKTDPDELPVENVSWEEAVEFCQKLSSRPTERELKRLYRLPTEAEWEYACRGPGASYMPFHFGGELNGSQANCDGNSPYGTAEKGPYLGRTCKVGSYKVNGFGLYDMHGNVWEWCSDWYGVDYYGSSPAADPAGPLEGAERVLRGGSWHYAGQYSRSAHRGWIEPTSRVARLGFRAALAPSR